MPTVSHTISVGQKVVLDKVCEGTSVRRSLLDAFSTEETDSILALAYYTVCRGKAVEKNTAKIVQAEDKTRFGS